MNGPLKTLDSKFWPPFPLDLLHHLNNPLPQTDPTFLSLPNSKLRSNLNFQHPIYWHHFLSFHLILSGVHILTALWPQQDLKLLSPLSFLYPSPILHVPPKWVPLLSFSCVFNSLVPTMLKSNHLPCSWMWLEERGTAKLDGFKLMTHTPRWLLSAA